MIRPPIVTTHARERFAERIGAGDLLDAWRDGTDVPAWVGAYLFRRGAPDPATYRFCPAPPCVLVIVPRPSRIVTVYAPRRAQLIALRRHAQRAA